MNLSTRNYRSGGLALCAAAFLLVPALASASTAFGEFGFSGPGVMVFNSLGAGYIQFCTEADPTCELTSSVGDFNISGPGTGSFSVLAGADTGTIDNTTDTSPASAPFTYVPVGVPVNIDHYLSLTGFPTWDFQLNLLMPAVCSSSSTQLCLGPFELNQAGPNVSVTMVVFGTLIDTGTGTMSGFDLAFSGQYLNTTIAAVEAAGESPAGIFSDSWSATADATATPEPGTASTLLLAGGGLIMLRFHRQRRS
jgi:hypothetical protein